VTVPAAPRDPPVRSTGRFSYTDEGEGPVIVAVHGLPGSTRDFRWLGAALPPSVRFIRLDLPGFGSTPLSTRPSPAIDERGAFVAEALAALGIGDCVLAGHSMGGAVVLSAAVQSVSVLKLALLSSIGLRPHVMLRKFGGSDVLSRAVDWPVVGAVARRVLRLGMRSVGFAAQTTLEEVAHTVRCVAAVDFGVQAQNTQKVRPSPVLCAWADDDAFIETPIFEEHAALLPAGPRLRWPTGGHNIQKSHAVELAAALVKFATT